MENKKISPTITKPVADTAEKKGKAMEAPVHPVSGQRRTVAADEEKKEREALTAMMRRHGAHGKDAAHEKGEQH